MIEELAMHKVVCDGCGRTQYQELHPDVEPPVGFLGTVTDNTTNGRTVTWFACRPRCFGKAAQNALRRDDRNADQGRLL